MNTILRRRIAAASLILLVGFFGATVVRAAELVLYDGASVTEATGAWDVSSFGSFEVTLDGACSSNTSFSVHFENADADLPDARATHTRGVFTMDFRQETPTNVFVRPIPPDVPAFRACVSKLHWVFPHGLFDQIWPSDYWTFNRGNCIHSWTLDPTKVAKVRLTGGTPDAPLRFTRLVAKGAPNRPVEPLPAFATLPPERFFPFIDRYGQFKHRDWPGKVRSDADLAAAKQAEDADLAAHPQPTTWDRWGGWKDGPRFKATGHFYVRKVNGKWWFVDPDGFLWWSHGPVRVSASCGMTPLDHNRPSYFEELPPREGDAYSPFYRTRDELLWPYYVKFNRTDTYDFTAANLYRKYGPDWRAIWTDRVHRRLRSWGANTIANSSDASVMAQSRTPYCDRFELKSRSIKGTEKVVAWWPFRDPFDPSFAADVERQIKLHEREMKDPWCFGFFVDNELPWGWPPDLARRTWESPEDQPARIRFQAWLKERHGAVPAEPSEADCIAFGGVIADAYFGTIRAAFDKHAPQKLYMGCRFSGAGEQVVRSAAKFVDVLSFNHYRPDVTGFDKAPADVDKPIIIGEFHFGAFDRGPFRGGLIVNKDQPDRAAMYKRYLTSALRDPRFVGAHWHQFCDDVATGRFDGENFQIGWVDICDTPYPETIEAVRWVGDNMYRERFGK